MAIEAFLALSAANAALQGGLAYGGSRANYEQQMANYRRDLLQSWLDVDRQNFAAATNNAQQIMNLEQVYKEGNKWRGRSKAQLKTSLDNAFKTLSYGYSKQMESSKSNISGRNAQGGSSEAILRMMQENAEQRIREASRTASLQRRQIDEQYRSMLASSRVNLAGASSFIPGSPPTDNSSAALVQGIMGGIRGGLALGQQLGDAGMATFRP